MARRSELLTVIIFVIIISLIFIYGVTVLQQNKGKAYVPEKGVPNDVGIFMAIENSRFTYVETGEPWVPTEKSIDIAYFKQVECPACKVFDPIFSSFTSWTTSNYDRSVNIYVIVVSKTKYNPNYVIESFINHKIEATPTVIFFKNGVEVERVVGVVDIETLKETLLKILSG